MIADILERDPEACVFVNILDYIGLEQDNAHEYYYWIKLDPETFSNDCKSFLPELLVNVTAERISNLIKYCKYSAAAVSRVFNFMLLTKSGFGKKKAECIKLLVE